MSLPYGPLPAARPRRAGALAAGIERIGALRIALLLGLALLAALPVALVSTPPFFDYLNHLSRAHVLAHLGTSPAFSAWFEPASPLIPNVGADLGLLWLMRVTDAETAGRLVLLAIVLGTLSGALALGRAAAGRLAPWPAFAALALYNEMLHWGFLNYALGLAVLLWGLAAWIALEARPRARTFAGLAVALLAFFCHLVAFGLFALGILAIELGGALAERRAGRALRPALAARAPAALLVLAPPALLFLAISPSSGLPAAPAFNFAPFEKLAPYTRLLSSGAPFTDALVEIPAALLLAGLALKGRLRLDGRLGAAALAMALAQMALPYSAMQSFFVDNRVATAVVLVLLCGLASREGPARPRAERVGWVALALLLALRTAALGHTWTAAERDYAAVGAAFEAAVPRGALLVGATATPFEYGSFWFATRSVNPPHEHTASLATIRREAVVPAIFAKPRQNPLVFQPPSAMVGLMSLGPIPRLFAPRDFAFLSQRLALVRRQLDGSGHQSQPILVFASAVRCRDWPPGLGFRLAACGPGFSIAEYRPNGRFLAVPRRER